MFLFYVDESGTRCPRTCRTSSGQVDPDAKDWLYTLTAVCLFSRDWNKFQRNIHGTKLSIAKNIFARTGRKLETSDWEVKSHWVRQPKEKINHPFLTLQTETETEALLEVFHRQLEVCKMHIFAVLTDKRFLQDYMISGGTSCKSSP